MTRSKAPMLLQPQKEWWNPQREDPIEQAIRIIRENEPVEGYDLGFSGGKDSVVLYDLAERSNAKFESHYSVTGIDAPEVMRFIHEHYPEVKWHRPALPYFKKLLSEGCAMRTRRWCCRYLKENTGLRNNILLGIRAEESVGRSRYEHVREARTGQTWVLPILGWLEQDIWWYIKKHDLPYCSLYDNGFARLGCVICPFLTLGQIKQSQAKWPNHWKAFRNALGKLYKKKKDLFEGRYGFICFEEFWWNWHGRRGPWPWKDKQLKLMGEITNGHNETQSL